MCVLFSQVDWTGSIEVGSLNLMREYLQKRPRQLQACLAVAANHRSFIYPTPPGLP